MTFRDPAYLLTHWVFMRAMHRSDPGASLLGKGEAETIGREFAGSCFPFSRARVAGQPVCGQPR